MNEKQRNLKAIGIMLHDANCRGDKRAEALLNYLREKVVMDEVSSSDIIDLSRKVF